MYLFILCSHPKSCYFLNLVEKKILQTRIYKYLCGSSFNSLIKINGGPIAKHMRKSVSLYVKSLTIL